WRGRYGGEAAGAGVSGGGVGGGAASGGGANLASRSSFQNSAHHVGGAGSGFGDSGSSSISRVVNVDLAIRSTWTKSPSDWIGKRSNTERRNSLNALSGSSSGSPNTTHTTHDRRRSRNPSQPGAGSSRRPRATRQNSRYAKQTARQKGG